MQQKRIYTLQARTVLGIIVFDIQQAYFTRIGEFYLCDLVKDSNLSRRQSTGHLYTHWKLLQPPVNIHIR